MEHKNQKVASGMRLMFQGEMVVIICMAAAIFLIFVPVLGLLALLGFLIGGILALVGLATIRREHPDYEKAFYLNIASVVLEIFSKLMGDSGLGSLVSLAGSVCSLVSLYLVIRGTNALLEGMDQDKLIRDGKNVWNINVISLILSVVALFSLFFSAEISRILVLVSGIFALFALIMYIGYLRECSETF